MSKLLSIIVPIYNGKKSIYRCLDSIYRQTYSNLELILIDDGSKDDSYEYVNKYIEERKNTNIVVKIYRNTNQGVSKTRNFGINIATGEWITFIDQDDYIDDNYCDSYMSFINECDADIVVGGYERVSEAGEEIRKVVLKDDVWDSYMVVSPWAHIYKKSFLIEHNLHFLSTYIGEDVYFNLTAYACTKKIAILKENCGYKWVFNKDSVSNSKQNKVSEKNNPLFLLKSIHAFYKEMEIENCIDNQIREYFFIRYVIWYELFTVKGSCKIEFLDRMNEIFSWLQKEYPDYLKNPYTKRKIKGEDGKIFLSVVVMLNLKKLHLDKFFLSIFTDKR